MKAMLASHMGMMYFLGLLLIPMTAYLAYAFSVRAAGVGIRGQAFIAWAFKRRSVLCLAGGLAAFLLVVTTYRLAEQWLGGSSAQEEVKVLGLVFQLGNSDQYRRYLCFTTALISFLGMYACLASIIAGLKRIADAPVPRGKT